MFKEVLLRVFYILFALAVSIALWMYVEITENVEHTLEVSNIAIEFINEDLLRDRGWTPTIRTEDLTLYFRGPRQDIARLAAPGALSVEVNLANITRTGYVQLDYEVIYPPFVNRNAVIVEDSSTSLIMLHIDHVQELTIPVQGPYTGGTASPYLVAEPTEFEPMFITVRGSAELVSRLSHAYVPIYRENLSRSITEDMAFLIIDEYGEEISYELLESLEINHETIRVTIPIREVRDVPLVVTPFHGSTTSETNINVTINPELVTVSADPDVMSYVNEIQLGTVAMTSFGINTTLEFTIVMPEGVRSISGETMATVYVEVLGMDITHIPTSHLNFINTPPGLEATILTQSMLIPLRGASEYLALVNSENIRVVADIGELNPGTSTVPVRIYIDGITAPIDVIGSHSLTVRLLEVVEDETEA